MLILMRALIRTITFGIMIICTTTLQAHEIADSSTSAFLISVKNFNNRIDIKQTANTVSIKSNGIPNHETGDFPRRGNPHAIKEQTHILHFTKKPKKTGYVTPSKFFGVAVNGVMFVPETAECWSPEKQLAQSITKNKDGSVILTLICGGYRELIWEIFHPDYLGNVKILEPKELKFEIKKYLTELKKISH